MRFVVFLSDFIQELMAENPQWQGWAQLPDGAYQQLTPSDLSLLDDKQLSDVFQKQIAFCKHAVPIIKNAKTPLSKRVEIFQSTSENKEVFVLTIKYQSFVSKVKYTHKEVNILTKSQHNPNKV